MRSSPLRQGAFSRDAAAGRVGQALRFRVAAKRRHGSLPAHAIDAARRLVAANSGSVAFSAVTGDGLDDLLRAISDRLRALTTVTELVVPFDRGDILAAVHREGEVLVEQADEGGMRVRVRLDEPGQARFREFAVSRP